MTHSARPMKNAHRKRDAITMIGFRRFLLNFEHKKTSGKRTAETHGNASGAVFRRYINEFWTSAQRQANSIQEVSYRACFKPQLPAFFIDRLSGDGDIVYDPFSGRGTTIIEAVLRKRIGYANDINPLSRILAQPRISPVGLDLVKERLDAIEFQEDADEKSDLGMFFHPRTFAEIVSLKGYLSGRIKDGLEDDTDRWIRMVATNRLTGHSSGFFSVYTLPPNQAVSRQRQRIINNRLGQSPVYRDVKSLILKKSRQLLSDIGPDTFKTIQPYAKKSRFFTCDASNTDEIDDNEVQLTVTSPPFLDIVQYSTDNWLRCWFNYIDVKSVASRLTVSRTLEDWNCVMSGVFKELYRITRPGGWVAFEVGEVRRGSVMLDEHVVPLGIGAGFELFGVVVNSQRFTKTSNIWGVGNNEAGTNTNRIVVFKK